MLWTSPTGRVHATPAHTVLPAHRHDRTAAEPPDTSPAEASGLRTTGDQIANEQIVGEDASELTCALREVTDGLLTVQRLLTTPTLLIPAPADADAVADLDSDPDQHTPPNPQAAADQDAQLGPEAESCADEGRGPGQDEAPERSPQPGHSWAGELATHLDAVQIHLRHLVDQNLLPSSVLRPPCDGSCGAHRCGYCQSLAWDGGLSDLRQAIADQSAADEAARQPPPPDPYDGPPPF